MNKLLTTIGWVAWLVLATPGMAQVHQAGQKAIELSAGALDGFKWPGQDNFGFFAGLSVSAYRTRYAYWKGTIHLNQKYYAYDQARVPVAQWLGEATYFTRVLGTVGQGLVLNVGGGAAGGYESVNEDRTTIEGATLHNPSRWVVGPTLALEVEYILSGQLMLVGRVQEYYLFRSSITPTRFNAGVGIKFTLPTDAG
jgi:hypothetical protein